MAKYLAILHVGEPHLGSGPSYRLMDEKDIGSIKLYGEFIELYAR